MLMIARNTPEGKPVHQSYIYAIMLLFFFSLGGPRWFSRSMMLGPYLLGMVVPPGPPLGSAIVEKFDSMVHNLFLPIFISTCGLRLESFMIDFGAELTKKISMAAVVGWLVKFLACLLPALYKKMPRKDAVALALILCSKGVVDLSLFAFGSDDRVRTIFIIFIHIKKISQNIFSKIFVISRAFQIRS